MQTLCRLAAAAAVAEASLATSLVGQYGHAYQAPGDFSAEEFAQIAARFSIFTVEKRHAFSVYGDADAPEGTPSRYNSIRAAAGTARKIKALNPEAKVLMYWNSALHFNMYECEDSVQPEWLLKSLATNASLATPAQPFYDYSVPAFRSWWARCAINAVNKSEGALDGLFLDAVPKVNTQAAVPLWADMVEEIRGALGPERIVIYNGFYLPGAGAKPVSRIAAGVDALPHADGVYVESFGRAVSTSQETTVDFLRALESAVKANPEKLFLGHHGTDGGSFSYVSGCFMMVAPARNAYFLSNAGYRVDQGLLDSHEEYDLQLGKPLGGFAINAAVLSRQFQFGSVQVDMDTLTATFTVSRTKVV